MTDRTQPCRAGPLRCSSGGGTPAAGCSCRDAQESRRKPERRCQPKRINNAVAIPAIEVEVPLRACVVRGLFLRTSQNPINAVSPTAAASEAGRVSPERSADRSREKPSTVSRLDCTSLRSAAKIADRVGARFMVTRIESVSLRVAAGWRRKADPGSFSCKRKSRSPRPGRWPMRSRLPQSPMACREKRPPAQGRP